MLNDYTGGAGADDGPVHRETTAERLLKVVHESSAAGLREIAKFSRISEQRLTDCRDGVRMLEPELQMRLAAAVMELAPEHRRLAHRLFAQAQSALRTSLAEDTSHRSYPRIHFR